MTVPFHLLRRAALGLAGAFMLAVQAVALDTDYSLYGDTLLWRLDPPDGGAPSYMVGTMHMVEEALQPSIDRALQRMHEAGALVVETDMTAAGQTEFMQAMMLPPEEGRALPDVIGEALFARLVATAAPTGVPDSVLRGMRPWGAALLISVPAEQVRRMGAGGIPFDMQLYNAAMVSSMPVAILEPIAEQIAAMGGYPEEDQVDMLTTMLDLHPQVDERTARTVALYAADDLAGLAALTAESFDVGDEVATQKALDTMVNDRNARMAERLVPLLDARAYLVAIGAMHLPGKEGVLNLLAERGWTITHGSE